MAGSNMPSHRPPYDRLNAFCAPARPNAEVWRTALGFLGIIVVYLLLAWSLAVAAAPFLTGIQGQAGGTLYRLINVALMGVAVSIVTVTLHQRPARSLLGDPVTTMRDFLRVLKLQLAVVLLAGCTMVVLSPPGLVAQMPVSTWLALLPVALPAILAQSAAEEIVFRSYLLQQLAARARPSALWMGVPSALFALAHYAPGIYGGNAWVIVIWAGFFGIAMADLTARSGTLGPAMAVHFTLNAWSLLAVGLPGDLSGLALYLLPFGASAQSEVAGLLPAEFLTLGISWLAARLALRL